MTEPRPAKPASWTQGVARGQPARRLRCGGPAHRAHRKLHELLDIASAGLLLADPRRSVASDGRDLGGTHELELFAAAVRRRPLPGLLRHRPTRLRGRPTRPRPTVAGVCPAATEAGFTSVHAVPMRAAGTVLGALGLFGTRTGELNDADLLVAQTLAHIACVAIMQERAPTPDDRAAARCAPR